MRIGFLLFWALLPQEVLAAELDGSKLSPAWGLPFVGILLSIALLPLLAARAWEHHHGKIAALWVIVILAPMAGWLGPNVTFQALVHTALLEYVPFILLLLALFTTASGILVKGNLHGSPATNTVLLGSGMLLASIVGTTGASMVLIRPVLRANDDRKRNVHVIVFFIFLVSNIGGALTPLGDPPMFLGFLRGVDFFWPTRHLLTETVFVGGIVLLIFFILDSILYRRDGHSKPDPTPDNPIRATGIINIALIAVIVAAILLSSSVQLGTVGVLGVELAIQNVVRDITMIVVTLLSLALTPRVNHIENGFSWGPISEVAKLFAAIFVTIIPVIAMLRAGASGTFAPILALVTNADGTTNPAAYFWLSGGLSAFLDNAPTYLVFFEMAGGDPHHLMTGGAKTLAAVSTGAVFMGAMSYIGNAPNFMVYAIARGGGVAMPSFFGYMVWSCAVLLPVFLLTTFIFFK